MERYKAPLEEHKFKKLVKAYGYNVIPSKKHHEIVDSNDNFLMTFAVDHSKSGKREVKPFYINEFLRLIQQLQNKE